MTKEKEWDELINNLLTDMMQSNQQAPEYRYQQKCSEQMEQILQDSLMQSEREVVKDYLFEHSLMQEQKTMLAYQQGMKDCVWILKKIGVIA